MAQNYTVSNDRDLSGDDVITFVDYAILANSWQMSDTGLPGDYDNNNTVDEHDLATLVRNWPWGP